MRKPVFGVFVPTWSDANRAVLPQKMARGLELSRYVAEAKALIRCAV